MLQFLLISAHNQMQSNCVSRCKCFLILKIEAHLHTLWCKVVRSSENQFQHMKLHNFYLYNPIKTATHSLIVLIILISLIFKIWEVNGHHSVWQLFLFLKWTEKWNVATQFLTQKFPMWRSPMGMESFWKCGTIIAGQKLQIFAVSAS